MSEERRGMDLPTLAPYLSQKQTLAIFMFIIFAFMLLAYRTEATGERAQRGVYEACLAREDISRLTGTAPGPDCEGLK